MRYSHLRTPRTREEAYGYFATFQPEHKKESRWWWLAAAVVMVAIVWMICS
jgi:hypothetical protein